MQRTAAVATALLSLAAKLGAQQPEQWRLIEEWRVGDSVSGPHFLLDVRVIRPLPDGRLLVLERRDQQVHILSPRGAPLRTIGRRGAGPGEFSGASGILIAPNGQIIVNDPESERLTFLSPNGDLLRTEPHFSTGGRLVWNAWFTRDGRLEEVGTQTVVRANGRHDRVDIRRTWSADYKKADTVRAATCPQFASLPEEFARYRVPYDKGPGTMGWPYPFLPTWGERLHTSDGLWISPFPDFRVLHRVTFGTCTPVATIRLGGTPIPVPARVRGEIQAAMRAQRRPGLELAPDPNRVRTTLPLFESLATDVQGRLWVERLIESTVRFIKYRESGHFYASGDRRFEVYSPHGARIATVAVPAHVSTPSNGRPFVITRERVYAIVLDENDVPYLACFRIVTS